MAGKNIILEPNQILFKAGDPSDGMYLIRKGELRVYLEDKGKEVTLATVAAGGMIGEMALFDKKPRSASVKAVSSVEVTQITNDDFAKLMKQIPNWFVSLMGTLSGRLRETNERLQRVEAGSREPFENTLRIIHVMAMIWYKDGEKSGKHWQIETRLISESIESMFHQDAKRLNDIIKVLVEGKIFEVTKNSYNATVLVMPSRGTLSQFLKFMDDYVQANKKQPCLPRAGINLLTALKLYAEKSAYDSFTVSVKELQSFATKQGMLEVETWKEILPLFKNFGDSIKLVKVSDGSIGFKASKEDVAKVLEYHTIITVLHENGLS